MANEEINSYEFYVKNFPNIKFMLDEKHLNQDKNIILIIFYDNDLYQNYLNLKKENDFIKLLKLNFIDVNAFNSEEYGVFMISGDILHRIDLIINNIFNEKGKLNKEELELLEVDKVMKNDFCFYISMIKIIFFDSKGNMSFKFNEIKSNYSNEDN